MQLKTAKADNLSYHADQRTRVHIKYDNTINISGDLKLPHTNWETLGDQK